MRELADCILEVGAERFAVSVPTAGDLTRPVRHRSPPGLVSFGVTPHAVERLARLAGQEGRLVARDGPAVASLVLRKVARGLNLLVAEYVRPSPHQAAPPRADG